MIKNYNKIEAFILSIDTLRGTCKEAVNPRRYLNAR